MGGQREPWAESPPGEQGAFRREPRREEADRRQGFVVAEALLAAGDAAGVGMTVTVRRPDGRYEQVFVNDAALAINGYERDEFLRMNPLDVLAPGEAERVTAPDVMPRSGGATRMDATIRRKDGRTVPLQLAVARVPWPDAEGGEALVSYFFDQSAHKETEAALRKSEANLRRFIEDSPFGMALIQDRRFVYANATILRLSGVATIEELEGRGFEDLLAPTDYAAALDRIEPAPPSQSRIAAAREYRRTLPDGTSVVIEGMALPFDYEGRPAVLAFARDVTERAVLAEQMARVDRLVALGTLAAGVAHEIQNPAAIAQASLEALERVLKSADIDAGLRARALALVADARGGSDRVSSIVRELRGFSRPDDERRPVDVSDVLATAQRMTERVLADRARLVVTRRNVPPVLGNRGRLEQVFVNLLLNAAQAMPNGDVEANVIALDVGRDGDMVEVTVRDNGRGIAADHLRRIFDPFFTTKPAGEGTGLGLAITHTIVTQLGGTITVESEVGKGTVFRVRLPVAVAPARSVTPFPRRAVRRARILIVDDEPTLVRTLVTLLSEEHDVVGATSGADALGILMADQTFDLVLCDLMMPYVTGMDLYERLAKERPGLEKRLAFMTGGAFTARARDFLRDVTNPRVDKPFSPAMVTDILNAMVAGK